MLLSKPVMGVMVMQRWAQWPHSRAFFSVPGTKVYLKDTSIMPSIPGLPALITMLFTPVMELRSDRKCCASQHAEKRNHNYGSSLVLGQMKREPATLVPSAVWAGTVTQKRPSFPIGTSNSPLMSNLTLKTSMRWERDPCLLWWFWAPFFFFF